MTGSQDGTYKAVVERVFLTGPHGPYALATSRGIEGTITFSLALDVWRESDMPEAGHEVVLKDLRRKVTRTKGKDVDPPHWRAHEARFSRPGDACAGTAYTATP